MPAAALMTHAETLKGRHLTTCSTKARQSKSCFAKVTRLNKQVRVIPLVETYYRVGRLAPVNATKKRGQDSFAARVGGWSTLWMSRPNRAAGKNASLPSPEPLGNGRSVNFSTKEGDYAALRIFLPKVVRYPPAHSLA